MITREEYLKAAEVVNAYRKQLLAELAEVEQIVVYDKSLFLEDTKMSVRLWNVIKSGSRVIGDISTVSDFENVSMTDFRSLRGVGPNVMKELLEICNAAGVKMKP